MSEIRTAKAPVVAKHYGPGDHPSGSSQEAHGGDGRWVVSLTHRFYDDHVDRGLAPGTVLGRTKTTVKVALTSEERDEMLSDARHYAAESGGGSMDSEYQGLVSSARAAVKRLGEAKWEAVDSLPVSAPAEPSAQGRVADAPFFVTRRFRASGSVHYKTSIGPAEIFSWEDASGRIGGWIVRVAAEPEETADTLGEAERRLEAIVRRRISKHHGPGPHASGSSQDEHGKWADHAAQAHSPGGSAPGQDRLFDPGPRRHPLSDELDEWVESQSGSGGSSAQDVARRMVSALGVDVLREVVEGDWSQWTGCRQIRHAAVEIVGEHDLAVDPAIHSEAAGPFAETALRPAEAPYLEALYLLRGVRDGGSYDQLVRGVKLPYGSQWDQFWETVQEGAELELPLLSFSDTWMIGEHSVVERYGNDVVMILEGGATGWEGGELEGPRYTPEDEEMWLADLEAGGWMEEHRDQLEQELAEIVDSDGADSPHAKVLRRQIGDIETGRFTIRDLAAEVYGRPVRTEDGRMLVRGGDYGEPGRWAGVEIDEATDPDTYYERMDYGGTPREIVTGGRLRVTKIVHREDGPDEVYLTQVAVYDPDAGEWVEHHAS